MDTKKKERSKKSAKVIKGGEPLDQEEKISKNKRKEKIKKK